MRDWAVETALAVSILMLVVLLLRRPVARLFGARAAYALWLAPAARLVAPPIAIPLPTGPDLPAAGGVAYTIVAASAVEAPPVADVAFAAWALGAAVFLGWQLWRHHCFISAALANGRAMTRDDVAEDLIATPLIDGPVATGLVHPLILVPDDFAERFTREQQRFALLHEQLHHRRGDLWANAAALIVTALLWFNPVSHLALRAFRRDMEAACDASLLAQTGAGNASAYAETILRCAARPVPRSLCALTTIDELKGRLLMLKSNIGRGRRLGGLILAGAISAAGLAIATPAVADEPAAGETKEFVKRIEIREVAGGKDVTRRAGPGELRELAGKCAGEKFEAGSEGGTEHRQENIKFVVCTKQGESLLPALEKAAAEIEKQDEMPAERKAEILAKLRAKIAELRARG